MFLAFPQKLTLFSFDKAPKIFCPSSVDSLISRKEDLPFQICSFSLYLHCFIPPTLKTLLDYLTLLFFLLPGNPYSPLLGQILFLSLLEGFCKRSSVPIVACRFFHEVHILPPPPPTLLNRSLWKSLFPSFIALPPWCVNCSPKPLHLEKLSPLFFRGGFPTFLTKLTPAGREFFLSPPLLWFSPFPSTPIAPFPKSRRLCYPPTPPVDAPAPTF